MFGDTRFGALGGWFAAGAVGLLFGCGGPPEEDARPVTPSTLPPGGTVSEQDAAPPPCANPMPDAEVQSLQAAFAPHFRIGVAVSPFTFSDAASVELISQQFNHLSPENLLKWSSVHPEPGQYNFEFADQYVAFGEERDMTVYGHVLVWHQQVPAWVFRADVANEASPDVSKAELLARLSEHITTVAGRFGDRIRYWDVVNEAFNDDGSLRDTPWRRILGDDYVAEVFQLADSLLPDSKLVYNDFSLASAPKRAGAVRVIEDLQSRGIRIDAVGEQGHYNMNYPDVSQLDQMLVDFEELGVGVLLTELDVDVLPNAQGIAGADLDTIANYDAQYDPYQACLTEAMDAKVAARWQALFEVLAAHADIVDAVTFWGVSDAQSWLNNWPVQGRTNYPLLFNRDLTAKSALKSVLGAANTQ
jgi:endo-1,4-beta-xylanase